MKFETAVPTDTCLRERYETRLFEIYHENSKLAPHQDALQLPQSASQIDRYLTTRAFRQYRTCEQHPLPPVLASAEPLQSILLRRRSGRDLGGPVTLGELGTLLTQSLGCTATVEDTLSGTVHALRAWPSAGGLYPLDTYVAVGRVDDLPEAIYHYNPITDHLALLPSRPVREVLGDAYFQQPFAKEAALGLFLVAAFDRTVAKYGERGYRLVLLDAGHAAQNLLLTAEQLRLGAVAMGGYCDDSLAADLGIDGVSEAIVHSVLIGRPL